MLAAVHTGCLAHTIAARAQAKRAVVQTRVSVEAEEDSALLLLLLPIDGGDSSLPPLEISVGPPPGVVSSIGLATPMYFQTASPSFPQWLSEGQLEKSQT